MFYPPEGLCRAEPEGGPIVFTFDFIGVGNGTGVFNFAMVIRLFETSPMFYLMDGLDGWTVPKSVLQFSLYFVCI